MAFLSHIRTRRGLVVARVSAVSLLLSSLTLASAADWAQWRGPSLDGRSSESSNYPAGWPPKKLWEKDVGMGCTSPILAGGRLYVMGWSGNVSQGRSQNARGTDTVYCLDAASGREVWKQSYPCRFQGRRRAGDLGEYGGPSSTPTLDMGAGLLLTVSVDGDFACWDARSGKPLWTQNLYDRYDVPQRPNVGGGLRDYGMAGSLLVLGDQVVLEVGPPLGTLAAFDKRTGKLLWASASKEPAGLSAIPVPLSVGGARCLANLSLRKLQVIRLDGPARGQTLAEYPWTTEFACNIPTPAVTGSRVALTSGYNHEHMHLVDFANGRASRVWESRAFSTVCSPVIHKDAIYTIDDRLRCIDLATGKVRWQGGSFYHGSLIVTADDRVLAFGKGRLAVVEARPGTSQYKELSRVDRIARDICYPHLAFSDGLVACKDRSGRLTVFSVRGKN